MAMEEDDDILRQVNGENDDDDDNNVPPQLLNNDDDFCWKWENEKLRRITMESSSKTTMILLRAGRPVSSIGELYIPYAVSQHQHQTSRGGEPSSRKMLDDDMDSFILHVNGRIFFWIFWDVSSNFQILKFEKSF
jgi:hypothetical protein